MAESKTSLCNQALARFGAKRINDFDDATDTKPEAIYCRLFFDQTAKALMKDHYWPFAKGRVQLSQDTTSPAFQYTYAFHLPNDFLRLIVVYNGSDLPSGKTYYTYEIQGKRLLTDESAIYLRYVKWVTDVGAWDPLFNECFILLLAQKLTMPLSQDIKLKQDIDKDLQFLMRKVRAMDRQEEQVIGRTDLRALTEARWTDIA